MRKKINPIVILSLLSGCSNFPGKHEATRTTASFEDHHRANFNGRYDGPPPEFKRADWERAPSAFSFCDKYKNATGKHVLTCGAAVEEAMNMATRYAGGHGREEGYLRGYAWGMNQGIRYFQDDANEMQRGEGSVGSLDSYLSSGISDGQNVGARDGDSLGSSEAKSRFYKAVDTQVMPNPNYQLPPANYNPLQDAYTRYVGRIPTPEDILKGDRYGRIGFYDSFDRTYGGRDWHERNGRDMWSRDGVFGLNSNQWVDGNQAFQTWLEIPNPRRQLYSNLNDKFSYNKVEKNRAPADETTPRVGDRPGGGGNHQGGNPGGNQGRPTNPGPTTPVVTVPIIPTTPSRPAPPVVTPPVVTPPVVVAVDFQAIFRESFIQAYNVYAPGEYSRNYYTSIDVGQKDGENVGSEVGTEIAQAKGLARAFNRNYAQASFSSYQNSFASKYASGFQSTYDFYKSNPVLSLNFLGIIGADNDGVVQPAEAFGVKFKVTNVGGVPSDLTYTVSGDVEDPLTLHDSVNAISSKTIVSANIGDVLSTLEDGSSASYVLDVNGLQEKLWQDIKRPLVISDLKSNFSVLDGTGMYNVTVSNISTVPLNGAISFELRINGNSAKTVMGSPMQPGDKKSYALDFSDLDPLVWVNGTYNVELLLKYNNITFSRKTETLKVNDPQDIIAQYYARLANEKGIIPRGKTYDNRLVEVRNILLRSNVSEVISNVDSSGNVYRTDPETTIPGKISRAKDSSGNNSSNAITQFTSLADAMSSEGKRFKSLLWVHPKRDNYYLILGKIGGKTYK